MTASHLVEKYYYQLTKGCKSQSCANPTCHSSGQLQGQHLTPQLFATLAAKLASSGVPLCPGILEDPSSGSSRATNLLQSKDRDVSTKCVDERTIMGLIAECRTTDDYTRLRAFLRMAFNRPQNMKRSFLVDRKQSGVIDYDIHREHTEGLERIVDVHGVRRCVDELTDLPNEARVWEGFQAALYELFRAASHEMRTGDIGKEYVGYVSLCFIALEFREVCGHVVFRDELLEPMLELWQLLGTEAGFLLARMLAVSWDKGRLEDLLEDVHGLITEKILINVDDVYPRYSAGDDIEVMLGVVFLGVLHTFSWLRAKKTAAILPPTGDTGSRSDGAGEEDLEGESVTSEPRLQTPVQFLEVTDEWRPDYVRNSQLDVTYLHDPLIPPEDFYNLTLSENLDLEKELEKFRNNLESPEEAEKTRLLTCLNFTFALTPKLKADALHFDHRITMLQQRRSNLLSALVSGEPQAPYLKVKVRREHVVEDALAHLLTVALEDSTVLKKQLVVEFDGEQAVDEGGVSKEFFQLAIEEICDPKYGLFVYNADTRTHWFNSVCTYCESHYTLMGILLGLAIYNNIILDLQLPLVIYRKLLGKTATFMDLKDYDPVLFRSLNDLLDYTREDIEDVFQLTFEVSYNDCFGTLHTTQLVENGSEKRVNHHNKRWFVALYSDFLLNRSIEKQYRPFECGFRLVTKDTQICSWFTPKEVELLVCGTRETDLSKLEKVVTYDGVYTAESDVIKWFWSLVHDMSDDEKLDLMRFVTGSHRIPVGGFSNLNFKIIKNGDNADHLPSAHTCYTTLLLPEYPSKDILQKRLSKALTFCKGFGLL